MGVGLETSGVSYLDLRVSGSKCMAVLFCRLLQGLPGILGQPDQKDIHFTILEIGDQ